MKQQVKGINYIQSLISEYESKYDKPTLEGFSMYLERLKQQWIMVYEQRKQTHKRIPGGHC